MKAFPYIKSPELDIQDSTIRKIKKYRQKLMPENSFSKCLILGVGIIFFCAFINLRNIKYQNNEYYENPNSILFRDYFIRLFLFRRQYNS